MKWQAWNGMTMLVHTKGKQNTKFYQKIVKTKSLGNVF